MIVDIFLFNDEFDHLQCRVYELQGVVDRFIGIEGNLTMSGISKPYRLAEAAIPGVESIQVDLTVAPESEGRFGSFWSRDRYQRKAGDDFMATLPRDDIVLCGDVDEIPRRESVERFADPTAHRMMMDLLIYSTKWTAGDSSWTGTVIGPRSSVPPFEQMHAKRNKLPMLEHAGWHLTWFGGEEAVVDKVKMFAHGEMADDVEGLREQFHAKNWPGEGRRLWRHTGDLPSWVAEGKAPEVWSEA